MCDYRRHYMHVRRVHYFSTKSWWAIWKRMGLQSTHTIHVWRTNGKWQATYAYLACWQPEGITYQQECGFSIHLYLKSVYGEMHESIGKYRDYLGMWLDFSRKGDVHISMEEYLCGVLENVQEVITMTVVINVGGHLFTIWNSDNKEQVLLDEFRDWDFHHGVVQLLFSTIAYDEEKTCKLQWNSCPWQPGSETHMRMTGRSYDHCYNISKGQFDWR